jgi:hypothetical protein
MTMRHLVLGCLAFSVAVIGCGDDDGSGGTKDAGNAYGTGAAPDYDAVSVILGGPEQMGIGSCAAGSSCHGGDTKAKANLNFKTTSDLAALMVDVPACENNAMMRVKPGSPEESWLWVKLTAEIESEDTGKIVFEGTPSACSGIPTGFGTRMPQISPFAKLSKEKLDVIYDWIKGGAPGPAGKDAGMTADAATGDAAVSGNDAGDDAGN